MRTSTNINVDVADIVGRAAQSPLGVLSLLCLVVGLIAYSFFTKAGERTKLFVFVLLFAAAVCFGTAVLLQSRVPRSLPNGTGSAADSKPQPSGTPWYPDPAAARREAPDAPSTGPSDPKVGDQQHGGTEGSVFVNRIIDGGDEPADCASDRYRAEVISGVVPAEFQIEWPRSPCKVTMHFDVQAAGSFAAPYQITFFDADPEGNGIQILTATVNRLPNRFSVDLGEPSAGRWIKMVTYQVSARRGETDRNAPTVIGKVEISH